MNSSDQVKLVRQLKEAGAELWAQVPAAGGWQTVQVDPGDVPLFLRDRDAWTAKTWGVSQGVMTAWGRQEGMPMCGGTTAQGRRCRSKIGPSMDPPQFAEEDGGYCHVHGGD